MTLEPAYNMRAQVDQFNKTRVTQINFNAKLDKTLCKTIPCHPGLLNFYIYSAGGASGSPEMDSS